MLRNKMPAPGFTLLTADNQPRTLEQLAAGKPLLLFFFRFADCPTSRRDLVRYAEVFPRFHAVGARMAAVSVEPSERHAQLRDELRLPFHLMSDPDFSVSRAYGIYDSDETDEGPQPHGEPAVFILDVDGNIAYSQVQTGPKGTANPAELVLMLLYMEKNGGRYW
jgi:peroxiredoxin